MPPGRRTIDRRRRVLYQTHADTSIPSAASRREVERLRQARRPAEAYGARVQRRLRGRWFSLVPVRRRTFVIVAAIFVAIAMLLCAAHYAAVAWAPIAYRPEVARPLRLDRPDSFGSWFLSAMLAGSAGAAFLIYQLRRYRIDDYVGRYRLWRLVLAALLVTSVGSLVSILEWGGAILDIALGERVALAGSAWLRLVSTLAGLVLVLRLIAEVHRCRTALVSILTATLLMAIPEAARWNVLEVNSMFRWVMVTSAPMFACTALFVSLGAYLRLLYREVRKIDDSVTMRERISRIRLSVFRGSDESEITERENVSDNNDSDEFEGSSTARRGWFRRREKPEVSTETSDQNIIAQKAKDRRTDNTKRRAVEKAKTAPDEIDFTAVDEDQKSEPGKPRRRWFGLRAAKSAVESTQDEKDESTSPAPATARGSRFSMRLKPQVTSAEVAAKEPEPEETVVNEEADSETPRRRGLGGGLGKKRESNDNQSDSQPTNTTPEKNPAQSDGDSELGGDGIDWDSMSKAERRRMRKQLKRQNRAA